MKDKQIYECKKCKEQRVWKSDVYKCSSTSALIKHVRLEHHQPIINDFRFLLRTSMDTILRVRESEMPFKELFTVRVNEIRNRKYGDYLVGEIKIQDIVFMNHGYYNKPRDWIDVYAYIKKQPKGLSKI